LYEWARNPIVSVIFTYIFATYFSTDVISDPVRGQAVWGSISAIAGLTIAFLAPTLGAVADMGGSRKPWLALFSTMMIVATFSLWWALPNEGGLSVPTIASLIIIIAVGFSCSDAFHSSMLPTIAAESRVGFLSGLALSLGNCGALVTLGFLLVAFMLPGHVNWSFIPAHALFGIDVTTHENSRIAGPLCAVWLLIFCLPLMLFTSESTKQRNYRRSIIPTLFHGLKQVWTTCTQLRHYRNIAVFLLARLFYSDAQGAILIFSGVYAAGVFKWDALTLTIFGIIISITSVCGSFIGGYLDGRIGSKRAILVSISGMFLGLLIAVSMTPTTMFFFIAFHPTRAPLGALRFIHTPPELLFVAAQILSVSLVSSAYVNSRAMLIHIAPVSKISEFFGMYALSGAATAFLGPLIVGSTTAYFHSQRIGMASILILLLIGFCLVSSVSEKRSEAVDT
jgi:UMF1 family MFS transporter